MIGLPTGPRTWLAAGVTDMRRGMDGLAVLVQGALAENPFSGVDRVADLNELSVKTARRVDEIRKLKLASIWGDDSFYG